MSVGSDHPATTESIRQVEHELIRQIESGAVDLPLLPQVASRVMALANDPSADAARLSALIHQDQALAAHVLRIANSPAYMPRTPIVSLQHAVAMLGLTLLAEIAFSASLKAGAYQVPGREEDVKFLWRHALASGAYAKEIARLRRHNVESAYLCGLLHAIGKPVVLKTVVEVSKRLQVPLDRETVMTLLEGYHARVGTLIAEKWGLPRQVAEAIAYAVCYEQTPTFRQEVMITYAADRLATYLLVPEVFDELTVRDHPVFADLNLYPNEVDALLAAKDKILAVVEALAV